MDLINGTPVVELTGNEFLPVEGKTFVQQVDEFFKNQGGVANSPFGQVVLDKKGVKNSKNHGINRTKAAAFAAVKDVLEQGEIILPLANHNTNGKKQMTGMLAAPIKVGDESYICVVVVIANLQVRRLYVHEAFITKNLQEIVASSQVRDNDNVTSPQSQGEIAKVLKNHLISKQNNQNLQQSNQNKQIGDSLEPRYNIIKENNQINCNKNMNRNNKNVVRLTESKLRNMIKGTIRQMLRESEEGKTYKLDLFFLENNTLQCGTDWDLANEMFTKQEAIEEANYYAMNNPGLDGVIRIYDSQTDRTLTYIPVK